MLSQKAASLPQPCIAGWLLTTARYAWFTTHAMAVHAAAPLPQPSVPAALVAAVSEPATAPVPPAVDLTTPDKVLDAFCTALERGNRAQVYACTTGIPR